MIFKPSSDIDIQQVLINGVNDVTLAWIFNGLTLLEKMKLRIFSSVKIGEFKLEGWSDKLPFYFYKCDKHGYQLHYPVGYDKHLVCLKCLALEAQASERLDIKVSQ